MVVKNFDKSLLELKNETVRVAASNYYADSGRASVQLLFGNGTRLRADYWRVTKDGSANISSFDHEQKYGLPAPIDAVEELKSHLGDQVLIDGRLDKETGDFHPMIILTPTIVGIPVWKKPTRNLGSSRSFKKDSRKASTHMSLNIESLSNISKAALLARFAHALTICSRDTCEAGTDRVLEPEVLRAYNELLHRVCGSVTDHLMAREAYSVEFILEMIRAFGQKHNRVNAMRWAIESASEKPLPPPIAQT